MSSNPNKSYVNRFGDYYALRHIPSGLYYVPSHLKNMSNLSPFPKLYDAKPFDLREGKYSFFYDEHNTKRMIFLSDWEIVVITLKETNFLNYEYELKLKTEINRGIDHSSSE